MVAGHPDRPIPHLALIEAATSREDSSAHRELCGRGTRNRNILGGQAKTPDDAAELMVVLEKQTS